MTRRVARLRARLAARLNPRLHPAVAVGIGLGLFVLLLPPAAPEAERHDDAEILARLDAPELDLEHGATYWLGHLRRGTPLAEAARERCARPAATPRPNCEVLASLERITAVLEEVEEGRPPQAMEEGNPEESTP